MKLVFTVELPILYFVTKAVATKWVFPTVSEPAWLDIIFLVTFILISIFFVLSLLAKLATKELLRKIVFVFAALPIAGIIYMSFLFEMHLWLLLLPSFILILLHLGIAKLLTKRGSTV